METNDKYEEFRKVVFPVMKYLAENYNHHVTLIITSTVAQMVRGEMSRGEILNILFTLGDSKEEFLKDFLLPILPCLLAPGKKTYLLAQIKAPHRYRK
jgi:hypothetical protein